jgi:hypothetical protein
VARIRQLGHDIEVITDGNQKWQGAAPNFSKRASIKIKDQLLNKDGAPHIDRLDKIIRAEPMA